MGYELDYILYADCPCGSGSLEQQVESNDWNQQRTIERILCDSCALKYHFERKFYYHSGICESNIFLVPNGKSLSFDKYPTNFNEYLIYLFSKEQLVQIANDIKYLNSSAQIKCYNGLNIVKGHKRWYKSVKISSIKQHIDESIVYYGSCEWNKLRIEEKKFECDKVERFLVDFKRKVTKE